MKSMPCAYCCPPRSRRCPANDCRKLTIVTVVAVPLIMFARNAATGVVKFIKAVAALLNPVPTVAVMVAVTMLVGNHAAVCTAPLINAVAPLKPGA